MELQRATSGFHSSQLAENTTFTRNETLWISKQNDPNEARAQLITLRQSILKLTGMCRMMIRKRFSYYPVRAA